MEKGQGSALDPPGPEAPDPRYLRLKKEACLPAVSNTTVAGLFFKSSTNGVWASGPAGVEGAEPLAFSVEHPRLRDVPPGPRFWPDSC